MRMVSDQDLFRTNLPNYVLLFQINYSLMPKSYLIIHLNDKNKVWIFVFIIQYLLII
jgi:hypothetical protein